MLLYHKEILEQALSDTNDPKKLLPAEGYLAEFEEPASVWLRKRRALVLF